MTSKITVEAHCADEIEVVANVVDGASVVESRVINNGETTEIHVHGSIAVTVFERLKMSVSESPSLLQRGLNALGLGGKPDVEPPQDHARPDFVVDPALVTPEVITAACLRGGMSQEEIDRRIFDVLNR